MEAASLDRVHRAPVFPLPLRPVWHIRPERPGSCGICRVPERCLAAQIMADLPAGSPAPLLGHRRLRKGGFLFREGEPSSYVWIVRYGTLKSAFTLDDGAEQVTGFHVAGDAVGLEGIADRRQRTFAVALEDSEVCSLPFDDVLRLPATGCVEPPAARLARLTTAELVLSNNLKPIMVLRQAELRVAAFLLMWSDRMRGCGQSGTSFQLRMSRAEIGSYLGLTLESVSRALSSFAAKDWIAVDGRSVRLLDADALVCLCRPSGAGAVLRDRGSRPAAAAAA